MTAIELFIFVIISSLAILLLSIIFSMCIISGEISKTEEVEENVNEESSEIL